MTSAAEAKEKLVARLDETLKRQEEVKETADHVGPTTGTSCSKFFVLGNMSLDLYSY